MPSLAQFYGCSAVSPAGTPPKAGGKMPQWAQGADICFVKPFL